MTENGFFGYDHQRRPPSARTVARLSSSNYTAATPKRREKENAKLLLSPLFEEDSGSLSEQSRHSRSIPRKKTRLAKQEIGPRRRRVREILAPGCRCCSRSRSRNRCGGDGGGAGVVHKCIAIDRKVLLWAS